MIDDGSNLDFDKPAKSTRDFSDLPANDGGPASSQLPNQGDLLDFDTDPAPSMEHIAARGFADAGFVDIPGLGPDEGPEMAPHTSETAAPASGEAGVARLKDMFPDEADWQAFMLAANKFIDGRDTDAYEAALLAYGLNETEEMKVRSLQDRLAAFEKSDEFKAAKLKDKLSVKLTQAVQSGLDPKDALARSLSAPLGANGLGKGESSAALGAFENLRQSAEMAANGGASAVGSLSSAVGKLFEGLRKTAVAPVAAAKQVWDERTNLARSDDVVRQQGVKRDGIEQRMQQLSALHKDFLSLPTGTSEEVAAEKLAKITGSVKDLNEQLRRHLVHGTSNLRDDSISDKHRLELLSQSELTEEVEGSLKRVAEITDEVAKAPALEGHEALEKKAKTLAQEAAEAFEKLLRAIAELFSQNDKAKEVGAAAPAQPAPSMPRL